MKNYFDNGNVKVGARDVCFTKREIKGSYKMFAPVDFVEDKALVSNYTYLFSKEETPLSIAIKFTPDSGLAQREKMIDTYFHHSPATKSAETATSDNGILYRETVSRGDDLSVYSLRFAVPVDKGILFGCFNCDSKVKDSWKDVVIQMLDNIDS